MVGIELQIDILSLICPRSFFRSTVIQRRKEKSFHVQKEYWQWGEDNDRWCIYISIVNSQEGESERKEVALRLP